MSRFDSRRRCDGVRRQRTSAALELVPALDPYHLGMSEVLIEQSRRVLGHVADVDRNVPDGLHHHGVEHRVVQAVPITEVRLNQLLVARSFCMVGPMLSLLAPALVSLFNRANWWFPARLSRRPQVEGSFDGP